MANGQERTAGISLSELYLERLAVTEGTGRPISERRADGQLLKLLEIQGEVLLEGIPSPNNGSQTETLINIHAFEAFAGETQQMLDSLAWLREKYFASIGGVPNEITDHHVLSIAQMGMALPDYLMLRAYNSIDREKLPEVVGNVFKVTNGFRDVAFTDISNNRIHTYLSPHDPYVIAEENHLFTPDYPLPGGYRCPANEPLITKTADALIFGNDAEPERSILSHYVSPDEVGNFIEFSKYHAENIRNQQAEKKGIISHAEYRKRSAALQYNLNIVLERDPKGVLPPCPR